MNKHAITIYVILIASILFGGALYFAKEPALGNALLTAEDMEEKFAVSDLKEDYELTGTTLTKPAKDENSIKIKIGREGNEFTPDFYISRWEDEVWFKMTPRGLDAIADKDKSLSFEGEKIKFETPDIDYNMYDLGVSEEHPEGAYEYEVILKVKPDSNVITFDIETQGLDFWYQPELTQEEIDEGAFRPENVIGSYAVYHSTKGGMNDINGMDYKVGKAFHIYRPQMEDANGWKVWGELFIDVEQGIQIITIPQDFIDDAIYPIRHATGEILGWDGGGASLFRSSTEYIVAKIDTAASVGTVTQFNLWFRNVNTSKTTNLKSALYQTSDNAKVSPQSNEISITDDVKTLRTITTSDISITAQEYYVCFWIDYVDTTFDFYYDSTGSNESADQSLAYGSWPTTVSMTLRQRKYSIYATYDPAGGEEPEEAPQGIPYIIMIE